MEQNKRVRCLFDVNPFPERLETTSPFSLRNAAQASVFSAFAGASMF
jgi:hypothetical protein